jgi:hypothetical protein
MVDEAGPTYTFGDNPRAVTDWSAHLPDPIGTIAHWSNGLAPAGRLVLDEIEDIVTDERIGEIVWTHRQLAYVRDA